MQVEPSLPADSQALEVMQERKGLLHDISELAQSLDVRDTLAGDHRHDSTPAQLTAVGIAVVPLVAEHGVGAVPWTAEPAGHGRDPVDQGQDLGNVVDVGGGSDDFERGALPVANQVVFAARLPAVDG